jgi:PAS domain S-box-containing protein
MSVVAPHEAPDRSGLRAWIGVAAAAFSVAAAVGALLYIGVSRYAVGEAEERVQHVLLTHRGLHRYIQEVLHPEFYRARDAGEISPSYYAPELLSSSYMVRVQHALYNEELRAAGDPPIFYKMAADNPRNPVNRADAFETELIRRFNDDRSMREYRQVIESDGKTFLYYAIPFLPNGPGCLRCHGDRADAPANLQVMYLGDSGFNESVGRIRAIEAVRVSVDTELARAWVASGSSAAAALFMVGLFYINGQLRRRVRERTAKLQAEVTERRHAEHEVRRLESTLADVVDSMPSALIVLDQNGRVTQWNQQARALSGTSADKVLGRTADDALPELAPVLHELLDEVARTGQPAQRKRVSLDQEVLEHSFDLLLYPIVTSDGERGAVLRIEDVTGQVELEAHVVQSQRLEAIGTLAGGIAHDFNNILSAIVGNADLAMSRALPPDAREDMVALREASQRARDLVRQILVFSRQAPATAATVEPASIVKETLRFLRASIPSTIEIRSSVRSRSAVIADPSEVNRLLVNLCTNAAQAMPERGVLTVELDDRTLGPEDLASSPGLRPGKYLSLRVRDTGVGMTPEVQERIFDAFYTTRREHGGTGMGLAVVHGIVQRLGGLVHVTSTPGAGSTFDVLLPVSESAAPGSTPHPSARPGRERVLFVDDEPALIRVAHRGLTALGYHVTAFDRPEEALAAVEAAPGDFDVLVTDMTMPGMTGDVLAAEVRRRRPDLPIILCTGFSERMTPDATAESGIQKLVLKPVTMSELSTVIAAVVHRR